MEIVDYVDLQGVQNTTCPLLLSYLLESDVEECLNERVQVATRKCNFRSYNQKFSILFLIEIRVMILTTRTAWIKLCVAYNSGQ